MCWVFCHLQHEAFGEWRGAGWHKIVPRKVISSKGEICLVNVSSWRWSFPSRCAQDLWSEVAPSQHWCLVRAMWKALCANESAETTHTKVKWKWKTSIWGAAYQLTGVLLGSIKKCFVPSPGSHCVHAVHNYPWCSDTKMFVYRERKIPERRSIRLIVGISWSWDYGLCLIYLFLFLFPFSEFSTVNMTYNLKNWFCFFKYRLALWLVLWKGSDMASCNLGVRVSVS